MDITTKKIALDIPYIGIQKDEFVIPVRLVTGVELKLNNVW